MHKMGLIVFFISFGIIGLVLFLNFMIFERIKLFHYKTWFEMGKPDFFGINNWQVKFQLLKFIKAREDIPLNDRLLTIYVSIMKRILYLDFAALGMVVIIGLYQVLKVKNHLP